MSFFYIQIGIKHFTDATWFMQIMPPYIPFHLELVYVSGAFEIILSLSNLSLEHISEILGSVAGSLPS